MMSLNFTVHLPGYYPSIVPTELQRTVETGYISATIYPTFYKHMVIQYSIPAEWGNCSFDVYRAESEAGPWFKITPTPTTSNFVIDDKTADYSKFMEGWYIVECILPSGKRIQSEPVTWQNKRHSWVELRAREIERRETLLLEKFVGIPTLIFRRKHYGLRCKNCWDPRIEKVTQDHCPHCLGTSFEGGYFQGFETLFQYDQTPNNAVFGPQGRVESNQIQAWTISRPNIEVFDVIMRIPDWKLFRVDAIIATELQTVQVRQVVTLTELAKENVEYKLTQQVIPEQYQ